MWAPFVTSVHVSYINGSGVFCTTKGIERGCRWVAPKRFLATPGDGSQSQPKYLRRDSAQMGQYRLTSILLSTRIIERTKVFFEGSRHQSSDLSFQDCSGFYALFSQFQSLPLNC